MPKNALIVGAPRSGTSLTSAIFANQGYFVGGAGRAAVEQGDDYNPFGYFEADDLIARNVSVFQRAGYEHHNTWLFDPITSEQLDRVARLETTAEDRALIKAYETRSPWLWKDPRLCMTLPYWAQVLDWNQVGVVFIERSAEDVYWSFRRKGWCSATKSDRHATLKRIQQHTDTAVATLRCLAIPHVHIRYGQFKSHPEQVAGELSHFFGLQLSSRDLNFHRDLDHSSLHGRLSGYSRILLKQLPRGLVKRVERLVPRAAVRALFPERQYSSSNRQL